MEKFTPEQLEAIEAVLRDFHQVPDGPNFKIAEEKADTILAALTRPAHSFREGEVIAYKLVRKVSMNHQCSDEWHYSVNGEFTMDPPNNDYFIGKRSLTLSEMPKAVEELRKEVVRAIECICGEENKPYYKSLKEALAAFDEAISHE